MISNRQLDTWTTQKGKLENNENTNSKKYWREIDNN